MSKREGNIVIIEQEPDSVCQSCGKVAECRPYGPDYSNICFECGKKDPEGTERRMRIKLFGWKPD